MAAREQQIADRQSTASGVLARIWWMVGGNFILALSLVFIFRHQGGFFHPADWVFWITVATLVAVRYLDVRYCDGQTATGQPASMTHWVRYAVLLLACALVLWAIAHGANHFLVGRIAQG